MAGPHPGAPWWRRLRYALRLLFENVAGTWLFAQGPKAPAPWNRYRDELVENTDFRKFDGALRMVVDAADSRSRSWMANTAPAGWSMGCMPRARRWSPA